MAISPHIARLRQLVGTELLQLPSVAVVPRRGEGSVLLVRHVDTGLWGLIGGAIELDERPDQAACREALEEVGVPVELTGILGAFSGPEYRIEYRNGDQASYVVIAYEAQVRSDALRVDGEEVSDAAWHQPADVSTEQLNPLASALLREAGILAVPPSDGWMGPRD